MVRSVLLSCSMNFDCAPLGAQPAKSLSPQGGDRLNVQGSKLAIGFAFTADFRSFETLVDIASSRGSTISD